VMAAVRDSGAEAVVHSTPAAGFDDQPLEVLSEQCRRRPEPRRCRRGRRGEELIFGSTCATYGPPERVPMDESLPGPINPYGESKLMFESVLRWYRELHGLEVVIFRYFNAAGERPVRERHRIETYLISATRLQGGTGPTTTSACFGTDYPDARRHLHPRLHPHRGFGPGAPVGPPAGKSGSSTSATASGSASGKSSPPAERVAGHSPFLCVEQPRRPGDPPRPVCASATKAHRGPGWKPRLPSLENIVQTASSWHARHPKGYA
jgi:UDP-glucose 4-epimerase